MFLLQNSMSSIAVILICGCFTVLAVPIQNTLENIEDSGNKMLVQPVAESANSVTIDNTDDAKHRVKRDGGNNKYIEATKQGQLKSLRLFLQCFKNMVVADNRVGGRTPLSPDTVKPVIALFKHRFLQVFFPDVGPDPHKAG